MARSDAAPSDADRPWGVLVVDDDPDVHPLLEVLLQVDGRFTVVAQAGDGAGAMDLAERHQPDAIVLDLSTPGATDGWDALPELRRRVPEATIVVFSAFPEALSLVDALAAGADAYLDKASMWELIPVMAQLLGSRRIPTGSCATPGS